MNRSAGLSRIIFVALASAVLMTSTVLAQGRRAAPANVGDEAKVLRSDKTIGDLELQSTVRPRAIRVAEPLTFELTIKAPAGKTVVFPEVPQQLGPFEIVDFTARPDVPIDGGNRRLWQATLKLETIETGELEIPSLEIQVTGEDEFASTQTLRTEPMTVSVVSLLEDRVDPTDFRDVKDVIDVTPTENRAAQLSWLTGGLVVIVPAIVLAFVLAARTRRTITPAEWALDELDQLRAAASDGRTPEDEALDSVSQTVRDYLAFEWGDDFFAAFSVEEALGKRGIEPETGQHFAALNKLADEVKFARRRVRTAQLHEAFEHAHQFIVGCSQQGLSESISAASKSGQDGSEAEGVT
jgi:hypothetical protein